MSAGFPSGTRGRCKAPCSRKGSEEGWGWKRQEDHIPSPWKHDDLSPSSQPCPAWPRWPSGHPGSTDEKPHVLFPAPAGSADASEGFQDVVARCGPGAKDPARELSRMSARQECRSRWTRFNNVKAGTLPLCWLRKRGFHRSQSRNNSSLRLARKGVSTEL